MPRYKLTLEYDGTPFCGWQRQDNGSSVQGALEAAVMAFSGAGVMVHGAGRTDAGVHALAMIAHFDLAKEFAPDVVRDAINHLVGPAPIAVLDAHIVADDFHARFSCMQRRYEYRIINRRAPLTLERMRAWRVGRRLDEAMMHKAAKVLLGNHDFTTFRAAACQARSPVKTLDEISVTRSGEDIIVRCGARSFLHSQVRSMTGALVEVGKGRWPVAEVRAALAARDRARCGPVAPAHGLYFAGADYDSA